MGHIYLLHVTLGKEVAVIADSRQCYCTAKGLD